MHIPGLLGMPRRIYTYEAGRGWDIWNLIVSIGVVVPDRRHSVLRGQPHLVVLQGSGCRQRSVGRVDARMVHDFAAARLQLRHDSQSSRSRRPLWDLKHPEDPDWKYE